MILVVADTSPLNYLQLIGCINVLPRLFDRIAIPPAVHRELQHEDTPETVRQWAANLPAWVEVCQPSAVQSNSPLQQGEADAISLAQELKAAAVLIDEREARDVALQRGLRVIGTIGILEQAASRQLVDLPAAFQKLQQTTFWVHQTIIRAALERDAERKAIERGRQQNRKP